jgi:Immunity protein 50
MTDESILQDIPGGKALLDWFGRVPRFHDANLFEIALNSKGLSVMRVHTWQMTNKVDARGYIELDKHVVVTITLEEVTDITLTEFNLVPGIIFDLEVTKADESMQLAWGGSYGVAGTLRAKKIRFDLQPGKP